MSNYIRQFLFLSVVVAILAAIYALLSRTGAIAFLQDAPVVKQWIQQLGLIGPIAVVALMATAIVISPVPSAPIALAAGAVYGHTTGTLYVAVGSELGAIIAFFIGRLVGSRELHNWIDARLSKQVLGSQNALMGVVFVSRLLPFISFDMVSYAAGVTPLTFWRFAIATLTGILPASFLLAHFGSEMASGEPTRIAVTLLLLMVVPLVFILIRWRRVRGIKR